jgi:hypothetical protein
MCVITGRSGAYHRPRLPQAFSHPVEQACHSQAKNGTDIFETAFTILIARRRNE